MYELKFIYDVVLGMRYELVPMKSIEVNNKNIMPLYDQTRDDMRSKMRANNGQNR